MRTFDANSTGGSTDCADGRSGATAETTFLRAVRASPQPQLQPSPPIIAAADVACIISVDCSQLAVSSAATHKKIPTSSGGECNTGKPLVQNVLTDQSDMRKTNVVCAVSLMAVIFLGVAAAAEALDSLELGAFAPFEAEPESQDETDQFVPMPHCTEATQSPPSSGVDYGNSDRPARQFYVSSIIGGSFLAVSADDSPSPILTAGGAMGVALDRSNGRLRVELEGRYRDPIEQTYLGFNREAPQLGPGPPGPIPSKPDLVGTMQAKAYGGWSVMANLWRDFQLTECLDAYGGGGIGVAGFETSFQQIDTSVTAPVVNKYLTEYAWQLGVGGIWNINDRVAVDLSYRVFGLGWTITANDLAYGFVRTEVLLSLRIYEPFRGLMR